MEALPLSETSVSTRATRRHIPEDGILHSRRCENLKSYTLKFPRHQSAYFSFLFFRKIDFQMYFKTQVQAWMHFLRELINKAQLVATLLLTFKYGFVVTRIERMEWYVLLLSTAPRWK
jgi:hypothetical protein